MAKRNKLTGQQVAEIKYILQFTPYTSLTEIARQYGCSDVLIGKIKRREYWKRISPIKPKDLDE